MIYKKGDRVKVYGYTERTETDSDWLAHYLVYRRGTIGKVIEIYPDTLWVKCGNEAEVEVHPKQCRKLKKKKTKNANQ